MSLSGFSTVSLCLDLSYLALSLSLLSPHVYPNNTRRFATATPPKTRIWERPRAFGKRNFSFLIIKSKKFFENRSENFEVYLFQRKTWGFHPNLTFQFFSVRRFAFPKRKPPDFWLGLRPLETAPVLKRFAPAAPVTEMTPRRPNPRLLGQVMLFHGQTPCGRRFHPRPREDGRRKHAAAACLSTEPLPRAARLLDNCRLRFEFFRIRSATRQNLTHFADERAKQIGARLRTTHATQPARAVDPTRGRAGERGRGESIPRGGARPGCATHTRPRAKQRAFLTNILKRATHAWKRGRKARRATRPKRSSNAPREARTPDLEVNSLTL